MGPASIPTEYKKNIIPNVKKSDGNKKPKCPKSRATNKMPAESREKLKTFILPINIPKLIITLNKTGELFNSELNVCHMRTASIIENRLEIVF